MNPSNEELLAALLAGPYSHFRKVGADDWRDPGKKNPGLSLSSKGLFNHHTGEYGSLLDLASQHDLSILNGHQAEGRKRGTAQFVWGKSQRADDPEANAHKRIVSYLTEHRQIPLANYEDLLKRGLIRFNRYNGDAMLVYPTLAARNYRDAIAGKAFSLSRVQRVFLDSDGSKKGKKHLGSEQARCCGFVISPLDNNLESCKAVVVEGLEDALTIRDRFPDHWMLVGADKAGLKRLAGFFGPKGFTSARIIADHDADDQPQNSGQCAAWQLGESLRAMGVDVTVKMPPDPKDDANSALQKNRLSGWLDSLIGIPEQFRVEASGSDQEHRFHLDSMNGRFAVVTMGSRVLVLQERGGGVTFHSVQDFKTLVQNRSIPTEKMVKGALITVDEPISRWWLEHSERREYEQVDFLPGRETPHSTFNLWRKWPLGPKGGMSDIPLFTELLQEAICSDNEKWHEYLWCWLAHLIQRPWEKPGVAVVLRSAQGTGKGMFARYVGKLLGRGFVQLVHGRHLHGHFNAHQAESLLVFADEAVWGGDKSAEAVLKNLITEESSILELKGKDAVAIRSCSRLLLASNAEWCAPVSLLDRRYFVLDVDELHRNDHGFFERRAHEMDHGGAEALMQVLRDWSLEGFDIRRFPDTPARQEQKLLGMNLEESWWHEILIRENLMTGAVVLNPDHETRIPRQTLLDSLNEYGKATRRNFHPWSATKLGMALPKLVPVGGYRPPGGRGARQWVIPPLSECRDFFERRYGVPLEIEQP